MILSDADLQLWLGHAAQDPYGEPLGTIAAILRDDSGAPAWLLLMREGDSEGSVAPLADATPTGNQLRVAATAQLVAGAPRMAPASAMDTERQQRAMAHYGLDAAGKGASDSQPAGGQRGAAARGGDDRAIGATGAIDSQQRGQIVARLRAAHAMEQASLKLLAAMRRRVRDEELVHDFALHHKQTNAHAERVRERLDEMEAAGARPLDWLAKTAAYVKAQRGRLRSEPEPHDVRSAYEFERREIAAYDGLERLTAQAADEATRAMARAIRADEIAMAATLRASRLWAGPGARRGRPSPVDAPRELDEQAPRS